VKLIINVSEAAEGDTVDKGCWSTSTKTDLMATKAIGV